MKRFKTNLFFVLLIMTFILTTSSTLMAFDFSKVKQDIKKQAETNKNDFKISKLGYLSGAPAGLVTLKNTKYLLSPKDSNLIILTGRAKLPPIFKGLSGKDCDVLITVAPNIISSKVQANILSTITVFFDKSGIADYYKKMDDNIFKELLSGKCLFTYSDSTITLTADMFPTELRKKFEAVLKKNFVLSLQKGVTLASNINFNFKNNKLKLVSDFIKFIKVDKIGMIATLYLSPDWKHITLKVALGDGFKIDFLPKCFTKTVPYFFVNLSELGMGLETSMKLPPHNDISKGVIQMSIPILLGKSSSSSKTPSSPEMAAADQASAEAFSATEFPKTKKADINLLGSLRGVWKDAFNIKNFTLYNLVLKGKIPIYGSGLTIGFGGKADIGKVKVALGGLIPTSYDISKMAVMGKASKIPFGDLIALIAKSCGKKKKPGFPVKKLYLKDVIVSVSPSGDKDLNISSGMVCAGSLHFGKQELGHILVKMTHPKQKGLLKNLTGFKAEGWIKKIKMGPFVVTGNGADGKLHTKDDGVYLDMAYGTITNDHLIFSGLINPFGKREVEAQISMGYKFDFSNFKTPIKNKSAGYLRLFFRDRWYDLYETEFTMIGDVNLQKPNFFVKAALTKNFIDDLTKSSFDFLNGAANSITQKITDGKNQINKLKKVCDDANKEANRSIDYFKKHVNQISDKLREAGRNVEKYRKELDDAEYKFDHMNGLRHPQKKARLAKDITCLKTKLETAKAARKTAELINGKRISEAAKVLKDKAKDTFNKAKSNLTAAQNRVADLNKLVKSTLSFTKVMKKFGDNFIIKEVAYESSFKDLKRCKTPKVYVIANIYGKNVEITAQLDFKKLGKSFLNITKALLKKASKGGNKIVKSALILAESSEVASYVRTHKPEKIKTHKPEKIMRKFIRKGFPGKIGF